MFRILAAALLVMLSVSSPALANAKRVALILGIGEYQHLSSLTNPVRDAKAIATELRDHGFEVSEHYNLDRADLLDALETFKRQAQDAEVALVYYAGHGMEIDGKNVVAPTDMEIECANRSTLRSVELDALFAAASPAPQQIVLLDACRNNPFPQCPTRGFGAISRSPQFAVRLPTTRLSILPSIGVCSSWSTRSAMTASASALPPGLSGRSPW
jgi:uncharacterized caspase-like protein